MKNYCKFNIPIENIQYQLIGLYEYGVCNFAEQYGLHIFIPVPP